jgi:putative inorganic carbon (HCO3(-)) transporter
MSMFKLGHPDLTGTRRVNGKSPMTWTEERSQGRFFRDINLSTPTGRVLISHERMVKGITVGAVGLLLGICVVITATLQFQWAVLLLGACALPFIAMIGQDIRQLLLTLIILENMFPVDINLRYREWYHTLGGLGGFNLSATTFSLVALYMLWIASLLGNGKRFSWPPLRVILPAVLYLGSVILSLVVAYDKQLALREIFLLVQMFLLFCYIVSTVRTHQEIKLIIMVLLIGFILQSLVMIATWVVGHSMSIGPITIRIYEGNRVGGAFGSPNSAGGFFSLLLVIAVALLVTPVKPYQKWIAMLALLLGSGALVLTLSRGGWLVSLVSVGLFCGLAWRRGWISWKWLMLMGLAGALLLGVSYTKIMGRLETDDRGAAESRIPLMENALHIIEDNPILGVGANNYANMLEQYPVTLMEGEWRYTVHNKYLLVWAETGIVGLAAYLGFLGSALRHGWRGWRAGVRALSPAALALFCGLIAQMIHMMLELYNDRPQVQVVWLIAGLLVAMNLMGGEADYGTKP